MRYEYGVDYCGLCRRRPREDNGNSTCPLGLPEARRRLKYERESGESQACLSFKVGDSLPFNGNPPGPPQEAALF